MGWGWRWWWGVGLVLVVLGYCLRVSVAKKRQMFSLIRVDKHFIGIGLQFGGLVHSAMAEAWQSQADMLLGRELSVLHLDPRAAGNDSEPLGLA